MGPRARRRLVWSVAVVAAAVVVGGVLYRVTGAGSAGSTPSPSGSSKHGFTMVESGFPITDKLAFGMTKRQVRLHVGKPARTLVDQDGARCWDYTVNERFHGLGKTKTLNAVRICFAFGTYQFDYFEWDGTWDYGTTSR